MIRFIFIFFLILSGSGVYAAEPPDFNERAESALPQIRAQGLWNLSHHEKKIAQILMRGSFGSDQEKVATFDRALAYLESLTTGELVDLLMTFVNSVNSNPVDSKNQVLGAATLNNPQNMTDFRSLIATLIESEINRDDLAAALEAVKISRQIVRRNWVSYVEGRLDPELLSRTRDTFREGIGLLESVRLNLKGASFKKEDAEKIQKILEQSLDRVIFGRTGGEDFSLGQWLGNFQHRLGAFTKESREDLGRGRQAEERSLREVFMAIMSLRDLQLDTQDAIKILVDLNHRGPQLGNILDYLQALYVALQWDELIADCFFYQDVKAGDAAGIAANWNLSEKRNQFENWIAAADNLRGFLKEKVDHLPEEFDSIEAVMDLVDQLEISKDDHGRQFQGQIGVNYDFSFPLRDDEFAQVNEWLRELAGFPRGELRGLRGILGGIKENHLDIIRASYQTNLKEFIDQFSFEADSGSSVSSPNGHREFSAFILQRVQGRIWIRDDELTDLGHQYFETRSNNQETVVAQKEKWSRFVKRENYSLLKSAQAHFWRVMDGKNGDAAIGEDIRAKAESQFRAKIDGLMAQLDAEAGVLAGQPHLQAKIRTLRADLQNWKENFIGAFAQTSSVYGEALRQDVGKTAELLQGAQAGLQVWLSERPSVERIRMDLRADELAIVSILNSYPENAALIAETRRLFAFLRGDQGRDSLLKVNGDLASAVLGVVGDDPERAQVQNFVTQSGWLEKIGSAFQSVAERVTGLRPIGPSPEWKIEFMNKVDDMARAGVEEIRRSMAELSESPDIVLDFKPFETFLRLVIRHYFEFRKDVHFRDTLVQLAGMEGHQVKDFMGAILAGSGVGLQKLLQILSKEKGIGNELREIFAVLESELPPLEFSIVDQRLREKIPHLYPHKFQSFARSGKRGTMAQTHLARMELEDGSSDIVAVRILIAEALASLIEDKAIFNQIGEIASHHPDLQGIAGRQTQALLDSTFLSIDEEADPVQTVKNLDEAQVLEGQKTVWSNLGGQKQEIILNYVVPGVHYRDTAPAGVLILEGVERFTKFSTFFKENTILSSIAAENLVGVVLGNALLRGDGFFHGDLHQGNIGVSTGLSRLRKPYAQTSNPHIVNFFFFDFGMAGRLGESRADVFRLSLALLEEDVGTAAELSQKIITSPLAPHLAREAVESAIRRAKAAGEVPDIGFLATELSSRGGTTLDQIFRLNRTINTGQQFLTEANSTRTLGQVLNLKVTEGLVREAATRLREVIFGPSPRPKAARLPLKNREFFKMIGNGVKGECVKLLEKVKKPGAAR